MAREVRNIGVSVRARLLDKARAQKTDFQVLLTRYALERLLYRLSVSEHRDRFILKGALLFATWVADPFRPTRDLDLLGYGDDDAEAMAATFRAICAAPIDDLLGYGDDDAEAMAATFRAICAAPIDDDGVTFDVEALQAAPIREDAEYGGVRVRTSATIAGARVPIQIDIGFGDAVTPGPVEIVYPVLLDSPAPHLRAYPVETVVAEKFEALVRLGMANSRLKDFYDLWRIAETFELRQAPLNEAVRRTFERRETALPTDLPTGLTDAYAAAWRAQWRAFVSRERMADAPDDFGAVLARLRAFLMPLTAPYRSENGVWSLGRSCWA